MIDHLYSVTELAALWGESRRTILRLINAGELMPVDTSTSAGRKTHGIPEAEVTRFLHRRQAIAKPKQTCRAHLLHW